MSHFASPDFWYHYRALPADVQQLADRCFLLMNSNPRHPSIHFKKVGEYWSARVGLHWRAVQALRYAIKRMALDIPYKV